MAIKFSELRELMKDTNIQTVKMSDPVYFHTIKGVRDGYSPNYMKYNPVSFFRLNQYKENNNLYSNIINYYPLTYTIAFEFKNGDFANNISLQYNKEMLVNDFNYMRNNHNSKIMEWTYGLDIFSCYQTNDNAVYKNPLLVKVLCQHKDSNQIIDIPIMLWRNGKWINGSYYKSDIANLYSIHLRENYYKDTIVDSDPNVNSSVLLYTNQFSFRGDGRLVFFYAYKGNDSIDRLYNSIYINHGSFSGLKNGISNQRLNIKDDRLYFVGLYPTNPVAQKVN